MTKHAQSGVTLVELLAAITLIGIIFVPVFAVFGNTYERTLDQGNESQMLFYAESIMEEMRVRHDLASDETVDGSYFEIGECTAEDGCLSTLSPDEERFNTYTVTVRESEYEGMALFFDIIVQVYPKRTDSRSQPVRLLTVVHQ